MNEFETEEHEISKSQRKREAHALQELGLKLTEFNSNQLQDLPITDAVIIAVEEYRNLPNSHGARKRQLQYIGKVMRECDYDEVSNAIAARLAPRSMQTGKKEATAAQKWAKKLELEGDAAISELIAAQPLIERQQIRQLLRNLEKAAESKKDQQRSKLGKYLNQFQIDR